MWRICSVVFHALTLRLPIQTSLSVAPKLPLYTRSGENLKILAKRAHPWMDISYDRGTNLPILESFCHSLLAWDVLVSVSFGCFSPSRCDHYHCKAIEKAVETQRICTKISKSNTPLGSFKICNTDLPTYFNYGLLRFKLKQFPYVVNVKCFGM